VLGPFVGPPPIAAACTLLDAPPAALVAPRHEERPSDDATPRDAGDAASMEGCRGADE
jgi:hypothetical protein